MAAHDVPAATPTQSATEDSLAYYKTQYEQLEAELADFQASSKELEAELEKDVEAAEKRERDLRQKVESLNYEVEEWKVCYSPQILANFLACILIKAQSKYKQAKTEAGTAQNALQKEITSLRDANRTIQSRLRDIEVSNDDMERQARHTTSSLEDLESKYNVAIERGVLADEEIRTGEQEREGLRIEAQRLRDELNDLRIEADIRQDRLRKAEALAERHHLEEATSVNVDLPRPQSALSEFFPATSNSSPTVATPHTKSASSNASETQTPPSPPTSDRSNQYAETESSLPLKPRSRPSDANITPKPLPQQSRAQKHPRRPSVLQGGDKTPHIPRPRTTNAPPSSYRPPGMVQSGSLYHLHGLMSKMQSLEQRVHSVRSKLPAPTSTPPRASPRSGSSLGQSSIPSTVTVRSSKKRSGGSNASSIHTPGERPLSRLSSALTHGHDRPSSRLSTGIPQPSPSREPDPVRPPSRDMHNSRPSSRASHTSRQSISHTQGNSMLGTSRPGSRQSMSGSRTTMGHYPSAAQTEPRRPRSSFGGSYAGSESARGHSSSVHRMSSHGRHLQQTEEEETDEVVTPTPSRRSTFNNDPISSIPSFAGHKPRISGAGVGRRTSSGAGEMAPPERKPAVRKLSEVGESY